MPASFQELVNSRIFKFIVGENVDGTPTEISVHEEALSQLSEPLRVLTKARAGTATWKDVSKDTFERFVQYAYTGDYSIPKTEKRTAIQPKVNGIHKSTNGLEKSVTVENGVHTLSSSPKAPNGFNGIRERVDSLGSDETPSSDARDGSISEKLDEEGTILNQPTLPIKKNKKRAAKEKAEKAAKEAALKAEKDAQQSPPDLEATLVEPEPRPEIEEPPSTVAPETNSTSLAEAELEKSSEENVLTADFHTLSYPLRAPRDNYEGTCEPSMEFEKEHSYSNVLLSHASLYVLGDGQLIDNLKALALFKLHKTLCTFELDSENIGDITDLARYAYSGEGKSAEEGGLRGLVCQYIAIHAKELHKDGNFRNLLAGGGQIVLDFFTLQLQLQREN